jgi:hypothetical protein
MKRVVSALLVVAGTVPAAETSDPFANVLAAYEIVAPGSNSMAARRQADISEAQEKITERIMQGIENIPPAETWGGKSSDFKDQVSQAARVAVAIAIAASDDGTAPPSAVASAAETNVFRWLTGHVATHILMTDLTVRVLQEQTPMMEGDVPMRIITAGQEWVRKAVAQEMDIRGLRPTPNTVGDAALAISSALRSSSEQFAVRKIVLERVLPRLPKMGAGSSVETIKKVENATIASAEKFVQAPYSTARVEAWSAQMTEDAKRMFDDASSGKKDDVASIPTDGPEPTTGQPSRPRDPRAPQALGYAPASRVAGNPGSTGDKVLIGTSFKSINTKRIVIPMGSFANAHLLTSAEVEIGAAGGGSSGASGASGGKPVTFNIIDGFRGPNGTFIPTPNMFALGNATANAGERRLSVQLTNLSYAFDSRRELNMSINGYVSDSIEGKEGMIGEFKWRIMEVAPWVMLSSGGQGIADAMKSNSTVQIVGDTTTTLAQTGDKLTNALWAGAGEAVGSFADIAKDVSKDIKPVIAAPNGQRVTLHVTAPIVFEVPEDEFMGNGSGVGILP